MKNDYIVKGKKVYIELRRKDGENLYAIIDKKNLKKILEFDSRWSGRYHPKTKSFYAICNIKRDNKQTTLLMHRFILGCIEYNGSDEIDHINHNTLDNTENNLRIVTRQQNQFNRIVKGTCYHKRIKKWQANIGLNYKKIHLGYFDTQKKAHEAYLEAKGKYHKQ